MKNQFYQEKIINEKLRELETDISKVEYLHVKLDFCEQEEEEYIDRQIDQFYRKFNSSIKELYLILLNYFETQGSKELLNIFKNDLQGILDINYEGIKTFDDDDFGHTYYICQELNAIKKFLLHFEAFDENVIKNIGLIYL